MKYIVAVDGGGSKTHLVLLSLTGKIFFEKIGEGCSHSSLGSNHLKTVIGNLYQEALQSNNIIDSDIEFIYLGLSGADLESDFEILNNACKEMFEDVPFKVVNDAWIIMRSGLKTPYGAVAISGTGTNSAAINKDGKKAILRSLGFTLGIYGGGLDIAREALHYAFRSEELTYDKTLLEIEIPKLFKKKNMEEIVSLFYPKNTVDRVKFGKLTGLVNSCAVKGDKVSKEILSRMGKFIGLQTVGVIRQVQMDNESFPVVIGGRVFDGESPVLLKEFTNNIISKCPNAYIVKPKYKPVFGAFLSALDVLKIEIRESHYQNLR